MTQVDLNELRNRVLSNQQQDVDMPKAANKSVFVDREGNIQLDAQGQRNLSKVPMKTFAATIARDRQTVAAKLPQNARETVCNGVTGWFYEITNELGDRYTMFIYNDGSAYQVLVVFPEVAGRYGVHDAHLFSDGRICLQDGVGMPSLETAFAKSVLWATGFSLYLRTGTFPLSINNL